MQVKVSYILYSGYYQLNLKDLTDWNIEETNRQM